MTVTREKLKYFIERIERLEEHKREIAEDIKDMYTEIKSVGFCSKTVRHIVSLRRVDPEKRRELEDLLDLYKSTIGME